MFAIEYAAKFTRRFKKLPAEVQEKYAQKEDVIKINPFSPSLRTHKLHGHLRQYWAASIDHQYRAVFRFEGRKIVMMITIGDHDVYKELL